MNHKSTSRRAFGLMLAAVFTVALVGPVAAKPAFFFQQHGSNVGAGTDPSCTGSGPYTCVAHLLNVFAGRSHVKNSGSPDFPDGVYRSDRVCYEIDHWANASADPPAEDDPITSYEFGCNRTVGQASFQHLASATLSPTTIVLDHFDCTPADPYPACNQGGSTTVILSGTWTGTGPTFRDHANDKGGPRPFCFHLVQNGKTRDAIPPVSGLPFVPDWSFIGTGSLTLKVSADLRCV